jgi:hypothetical protein
VNLGDVVVEGDDLLGDGVNVGRLEQLCGPGGVLVSGTAYDHLQGKLDLALDDAGEQPVKKISRPVRTYRVRLDGTAPRRRWTFPAMPRWAIAGADALFVMALGGLWQFWPAQPPAMTRAGLAVLPFDNLSGDEATGRIADGLTEDIITLQRKQACALGAASN